jgi:ParB family chromosome partitioning protein
VLGRGLADLIPVAAGGAAAGAPPRTSNSGGSGAPFPPTQEIAIAEISPNPRQPRTHFDEAALAELATSIKTNGLLQPILVRPRAAAVGGYEIVAGERRYRAATKAGLARVPAVIRDLTDEESLALALVENLVREDISPLETARALRRLMNDFGWTQDEAARRVGKSRPAVANVLRLLNLPPAIQESVECGEISEGHARALLAGNDPERQRRVWQKIRQDNISVRDVERLMKEPDTGGTAAGAASGGGTSLVRSSLGVRPSVNLQEIEDRLRRALVTRVKLAGSEQKGRIEIEYASADELDGLLQRIEGQAAPVAAELPPAITVAPPVPKRGSGRIQGLLSSPPPQP